jgi:hypothetical protein
MPSLLTHHYFASLVIEKYKKVMPFLLDHYSVVTLGAQGPDPLFFYGNAPFKGRKNSKKINDFGSELHANPHHLIDLLLLKNDDLSNLELSYLLGALTHYVLDRTVHPYVFYHTGFDQAGNLVAPYQGAHAKFEVSIDAAVIVFYQLDQQVFHPEVTLGVSEEGLAVIDAMYHKVYSESMDSGVFVHAVEDMKKTISFLYKPNIFKKSFIFMVTGKKSLPYNLIHPKNIDALMMKKLLNLEHASYQDPVTGNYFKTSFPEMVEESLRLIDQFISVLLQSATSKSEQKDALVSLLNAIDYDGKPIGSKMTVFVPFYKSFEK